MQIYTYYNITKENCDSPEKCHFVRDDACFIDAWWSWVSGAGVTKVRGTYYPDQDDLPLYFDKDTITAPDSYRFIIYEPASKKLNTRVKLYFQNGTGVFTLKVKEYYNMQQTRLIG